MEQPIERKITTGLGVILVLFVIEFACSEYWGLAALSLLVELAYIGILRNSADDNEQPEDQAP